MTERKQFKKIRPRPIRDTYVTTIVHLNRDVLEVIPGGGVERNSELLNIIAYYLQEDEGWTGPFAIGTHTFMPHGAMRYSVSYTKEEE